MKLPLYVKIPIPGPSQALYGKDEISVVVILEMDNSLLPLFCPGSVHNIGVEFEKGEDLTGKGCTTILSAEIEKPFTEWNDGKMTNFRILAHERLPQNPMESEFKTFVHALLVSTNVFVLLPPKSCETSALEANSKKQWFVNR